MCLANACKAPRNSQVLFQTDSYPQAFRAEMAMSLTAMIHAQLHLHQKHSMLPPSLVEQGFSSGYLPV